MAGDAASVERRQMILRELGIETWRLRAPERACAMTQQAASAVPDRSAVAVGLADAWDELRRQVRDCRRCELHRSRTQTVFGVGNPHPSWVIVGEAPGAEEDRQGEPFVGAAGQLLNQMLRAVGVGRGDVFIANILKCRPPDNRDPTPTEVAACADHLAAQLSMLAPRLILAVGRVAAQSLLRQDVPVGQLRGREHAYGNDAVPLIVTYHPAYLLRSPGQKRRAWEDLQRACRLVKPQPP